MRIMQESTEKKLPYGYIAKLTRAVNAELPEGMKPLEQSEVSRFYHGKGHIDNPRRAHALTVIDRLRHADTE